ncbi:hypothetical protein J6590_064504 [Homalodisca vitripennis]|nr:hypothetical protein J6590_064504 [Homalodisca vitripennis]
MQPYCIGSVTPIFNRGCPHHRPSCGQGRLNEESGGVSVAEVFQLIDFICGYPVVCRASPPAHVRTETSLTLKTTPSIFISSRFNGDESFLGPFLTKRGFKGLAQIFSLSQSTLDFYHPPPPSAMPNCLNSTSMDLNSPPNKVLREVPKHPFLTTQSEVRGADVDPPPPQWG